MRCEPFSWPAELLMCHAYVRHTFSMPTRSLRCCSPASATGPDGYATPASRTLDHHVELY